MLTHQKKSSTGNYSQCLQTYVNVMAHLPSFSLTTCLKKSVLVYMKPFVFALLASTSSNTAKFISIVFLVHAGISSFLNSPSLHTFAMPKKKAFHWTPLIHLCTTPAPLSFSSALFSALSWLQRSFCASPSAISQRLDLQASIVSSLCLFSSERF